MTVAPRTLAVLSRYGRLGASSRVRLFQYYDALKICGWQVVENTLIDDRMLAQSYAARGGYDRPTLLSRYARRALYLGRPGGARAASVIWIEKEAFPWAPAWMEKWLLRDRPYALDYDDAIFHNYDLHPRRALRWMMGRKIDRLMRGAALVTAGNRYLAERARVAGAPWVEILPTVVDLDRYPARVAEPAADPCRVVWIGSPSTVAYLETLRSVFGALARDHNFVLRVIGAAVDWPEVNVECARWTENTEVARLAECHLGIMPLPDEPFERGKCGYKLIQYMACGLPVVASPVGVNVDIVDPAVNGFLATTPGEWHEHLASLLQNTQLRATLGRAGRAKIEAGYSLQVMAGRLDALLSRVATGVGSP